MGVKAFWGPKVFGTSQSRIVPFDGFSTSVSLKADSENDTSGTEPINTRGRELQNFSCGTTYYAVAGCDPMGEFYSWVSLIGASYPMYIGGRRLGPAERFTLQDVSMSDIQQAENGAVLSASVSLSFVEYSVGKTSKLADTSEGTGSADTGTGGDDGNTSASDRARATYNATVASKKAAKNATASKADRASNKVGAGAGNIISVGAVQRR